ncbi:glycosyltransferase family 2 protein [Stenotrophomonas forensis]|uniref:glycosyltransferase family 2 protein n=1 Tax=Stenotrophomonas forensis TaxID=2871169 RepID=UPI0039C709BA
MPDAPSGSAPAERIGVALCTYNGARYLQAQLDSILDQDFPVSEVVIGDDGSSDQTLPLLQAFEVRAQALGIRVEIARHPRNLGYVRNFADALQRCQADILFLCDQDDVWHPGRVSRYVQCFRADPGLLLVHSDARLVDAQGAPVGQRLLEVLVVHPAEVELERSGRAIDAILLRNFVTGATCALRRSLLEGALPVPPGWSHDEWLAVHASLRGGLDMLAEPTIDYRQHGNNQIGASRRGFLQRLRHLDLFDGKARQRTAARLLALDALLVLRGVRVAPERFQGLSALAWRMAWSRLQLYRRADVQARWIAHDAPRLFARLANVCLAGAGWRGVRAALAGAAAGWRELRTA